MSPLLLEGKEVPPPICRAFQAAVEEAPSRLLFEFGRLNPPLMKGLSPRPDSLPILRRRIQSLISSSRQPAPELLEILRESSLQGRLLVVLSQTAIEAAFEPLAIYFGEAELLAGLLLDQREPLRSRAWQHLEQWPEANHFASRDRNQARQTLAETFAPFLTTIAPLLPERKPEENSKTHAAALTALRETLQKEQAARRRAEKERDRLRQEQEEKARQYARFDEERNHLRHQIQEAQTQNRQLAHHLADLRAQMDRRIREALQAEWQAEAARWLLPLQTLESAAQTTSHARSLLDEARAVLAQQAERDRLARARKQLEDRLAELEAVRQEIAAARRNSLNPHPRLATLDDQLSAEIHQIQRTLGLVPAPSDTEQALLVRINESTTLDEIQAIRQWLDGPVATWRLFPPEARNRLLTRLEEKHSELLTRLGLLAEPPEQETDPTHSIRRLLALPAGRCCLFVDGHNFLLNHPLPGHSAPEANRSAREQLADRLRAVIAHAPDVRLRLYFDGPERSEHNLSENVQIIYSGGGKETDRADAAILQDLAFFRSQFDHCLIITDDADLKTQAAENGARSRAQNLLAALLNPQSPPPEWRPRRDSNTRPSD